MRGKLSCGHNNGRLDNELIKILERVEKTLFELTITSGYRCEECNKKVGGKPDSAHLKGLAVDIEFKNSRELYFLIKTFIDFGIPRIGINFNKKFVHIDIDRDKPLQVIFGYG